MLTPENEKEVIVTDRGTRQQVIAGRNQGSS